MTAVDDVSFELKQGECLGIVGESGSGKSTIAKMITHLESITEGQVFLKGKDITNARGKDLRETYQDIQTYSGRRNWGKFSEHGDKSRRNTETCGKSS